eukprot:8848951-Ditylum_brightwellii.AAC.1
MPDLINKHASSLSSSTCSDGNTIGIGIPETKEVDPDDGLSKVLSANHITALPNTQEEPNHPSVSQERLVELNTDIDEESLKDQYDSQAKQQEQEQ